MNDGCSCQNEGETLVFTCAGAAHSGQVANRAGVSLAQNGVGSLFCVAAVAARIPEKLDRSTRAGRRVVIDGCGEHCARKVMESAGLSVDLHVDVTEIGVEKSPDQPGMIDDARLVTARAMDALASP